MRKCSAQLYRIKEIFSSSSILTKIKKVGDGLNIHLNR